MRVSPTDLLELLDYDKETGVLVWRQRGVRWFPNVRAMKSWNSSFAGRVAGHHDPRGYVLIRIKQKHYWAHRIAFAIVTGEWPEKEIDHIDNDKANNCWANLRAATGAENRCNRPAPSNNTSGYKGVDWMVRLGKWRATIKAPGEKARHLGLFETREAAYAAYAAAVPKYHGEFAYDSSGKEMP